LAAWAGLAARDTHGQTKPHKTTRTQSKTHHTMPRSKPNRTKQNRTKPHQPNPTQLKPNPDRYKGVRPAKPLPDERTAALLESQAARFR
jgi:hypothetical protein